MAHWEKIENYCATVDNETEMITKEYTTYDLWQEAWSKAGKSLFYMQFIYPGEDGKDWEDWGGQEERVEKMCYHLAAEHSNHIDDTPENRKWFKDWIEKFDDEVENQC